MEDFKISIADWNVVEKVGLPEEDYPWLIFITKSNCSESGYEWGFGEFQLEYSKKDPRPIVRMCGGFVYNANDIIAWKFWCGAFEDDDDTIDYPNQNHKVNGCHLDVCIVDE